MKLKSSFLLSALSFATLFGANLKADTPMPLCEETFDSCMTLDHPLFPELSPHLFTIGGDFLTARARDTLKHGHRWVFMPGAHIGYDYLRPSSIYVGLRGELGWFQGKDSSRIVEKPSLVEARLGYNFSYNGGLGCALLSPYVGFGVASSKVRFDKLAHVRASYVSLGIRSRYALCSSWSIGCDAQVIRTVSVHSHYRMLTVAAKPNKHWIKSKIENGWTGELALPITYYIGEQKQWSIEAAPYVTGLTLSKIRPAYGARVTLGCRF